MARPVRILTVCLGNICRSPVAEAAIRAAAEEADVDVEVASAGTGAWHVGNPPDERMTAAAQRVGIEVGGTAQQVAAHHLRDHDLVVAMDRSNLSALEELAASVDGDVAEIALLRSFDPAAGNDLEVPDPYYGGRDGFDHVVDLVQPAARGVIAWARQHDPTP